MALRASRDWLDKRATPATPPPEWQREMVECPHCGRKTAQRHAEGLLWCAICYKGAVQVGKAVVWFE